MKIRFIFWILLLLGISIRLVNINQPFLEYNATRQVETAMVVRNFVSNGFNFLYPEVDDQGKGPTYLMQEFPLITAPLSGICFVIKAIPEWLLRLTSVISFILALIFFYKIVSFCWDEETAIIASIIFIFSPLSILMSRVFQPDMAMLSFILICFYGFSKWSIIGQNKYIFPAIIGFTGAVLLKIVNLYILIPIIYLAFIGIKGKKISYLGFVFFLFFSFIPIVWWWGIHAPRVRALFPNEYDIFGAAYIAQSIKEHIFYMPFYKEIFKHTAGAVLTPAIFLMFICGIFSYKNKNKFLYLWLAGFILFVMLIPEQSKQEYYMLGVIPIAAIFSAKIMISVFTANRNKFFIKPLILIFTIASTIAVIYWTLPKYFNTPEYSVIIEAGNVLDKIADKGDLIVASYGYGPRLLYYCKRKGWTFLIDRNDLVEYYKTIETNKNKDSLRDFRLPIEDLEFLKNKGAKYFVLVNLKELEKNIEFKKYLFLNYKIAAQKSDSYVILKLN
ncbi:dolichyl-phosphate-mannose-protein mannosyltransferase [Candidatus Omnitrophus magneticus]|uniref:Dolichyl-phosphate-mannose-protein mannosyltransferase n=1 Tax=Candidatus Omnitrophus magneticus TaxID=1609969 RepID=A0A0F0CTK3_9BACT|nr:dolichyl-phosphate-mannose-protein mannosyltransferase [Candidatus Omnitrophus magneticus]